MGTFAKEGYPLQNKWKAVAASQTTAQISNSGDGVPGRDYLERVYIQYTSTASPGAVTVFDGAQALFVCTPTVALIDNLTQVFEVGLHSQTTKGFNVTTGSSVSCICIGVF
jgi:hypothetical protein